MKNIVSLLLGLSLLVFAMGSSCVREPSAPPAEKPATNVPAPPSDTPAAPAGTTTN
ncbi:MAG: hypothetical protein FWE67_02885 [Planctomycetaceae bacterium]|nr:hypothetical protein [Planctomycetaceae bacterium]